MKMSSVMFCWTAIILIVNKVQIMFAGGYLNVGEELSTHYHVKEHLRLAFAGRS